MQPVVSIITPSFNRANIIDETAQSILNQTYPHWEWVIVDDGSTDNSWEVLRQFAEKDNRVRIFQRNREPKGACTCRNIGVRNCSGEYLLFLDTDDLLASFCLQQRVSIMQEYPDCDFVIFPMLLFKQRPDDLKLLWNIDSPLDDVERILLGDPVCQGTGTLWKKSSFVKVGMWSEPLLLWQDIELHLRSLLKGAKYEKRLDLPPDVFLRVSDISLSRTGYHSLPKFLSRLQVLQQTIEQIQQNAQLQKYRNGLRHMFTDMFINAANSNYHQQVQELLQWQQQQANLFSAAEQKKLVQYAFVRKSKLYKIPFLQSISLSKLEGLSNSKERTLSKIAYRQTVQI
jgi:glycosyltransferase involved in cell wall biosynthesis